jgi:tetratricopeptide (TPR) repeat protein
MGKQIARLLLLMIAAGAGLAQASSLSDIEMAVMDKNYKEARVLSSKLLKASPDREERIEAEYYLGLSQLRLGQYAEARKAFIIVMQSASTSDLYEKAALGMVESLYMSGFYKDALKEGQKLLRKGPNSPSKSLIYLKIARTHLKLMQWQKAKDYLQKIVNEFPQSFEAPIAKGLLEEKEFFTVQVGAFLDQAKAVMLMEELKSKDQYAYVVETTSTDGKKFYRVRVGQMTSLSQAQALESQLGRQGYPTLIYP